MPIIAMRYARRRHDDNITNIYVYYATPAAITPLIRYTQYARHDTLHDTLRHYIIRQAHATSRQPHATP